MKTKSQLQKKAEVFTLALIASAVSTVAHSAALEEVIVTAQKRAENMQDVPTAISAFSSDQIDRGLIESTVDLVKLVPSLSFSTGTLPTESAFRLRGAGTQSQSDLVEPSVAVVYDGVVMTRTAQGVSDLADIERIEVLRGPQGTLFGKNASAGVIHVITKRPSQEFEGSVEAMAAEDGLYGFKGTVSAPISDTVGYRLSGHYRNDDGYIDNVATGNTINGTENMSLRGKLEFQPNDKTNILVTADYSEEDSSCCVMMPILNPDGPDPEGYAALIAPTVADRDSREVNQTADPSQEQDAWGLAAEVNYDLDWGGTLTSITSYRDWNWDGTIPDIDFQPLRGGTAVPGSFFTFTRQSILYVPGNVHENQTFSQELRIASPQDGNVDWVAGLFYWNSDYDQDNTLRDAICLGPEAVSVSITQPCPAEATNFMRSGQMLVESNNENFAAFGQVNWRVSDPLELFAGLRLIREELEWSGYRPNAPAPGFPTDAVNDFGVPGGGDLPFQGDYDVSDTGWSGKFGGKYDLSENVRVYASYARGYKGPAANANAFNFSTEPVDPETVDSYEIGLRSELFDNRMNLNVTAFFSTFDDYQTQTIDQVSQAFNTENVGTFETQGVELEIDAAITDNLGVSAAIAYTDSVFDEYENAECYVAQTVAEGCIDGKQDLSGKESPNSPEWKYNLSARYQVPVGNWVGFVQGDYTWQDDIYFREDLNPYSHQKAYGLFDLSFGVDSADERYNFTVFVKNVFDKQFSTNGFQIGLPPSGASGVMILSRNADRYAGASIRVNF
ncbi:MAG: TonB-dependent receptor [Haliea sp.]|uniref:TonB-dependent receptor n=1 Tax=Marinobacter salarius TaxID=1420917 RepID=UPI0032EB84DF